MAKTAPKKKGNWMAEAFANNKGALRKQLGAKPGKPIDKSKLAAAAKKSGTIGKRARLAQTAAKIARKRKGK